MVIVCFDADLFSSQRVLNALVISSQCFGWDRRSRSGTRLGAIGVAGYNGQGVGAPASPWPRMRAACSRLLKVLHHVTKACTDFAVMR